MSWAGPIPTPEDPAALSPEERQRALTSWYRWAAWSRDGIGYYHVRAFDRGGHFAVMEEPDLLVGDVRAFFRQLREGSAVG